MRKPLSFITVLFSAVSALGFQVQSESGKVILKDSNCESLELVANSFANSSCVQKLEKPGFFGGSCVWDFSSCVLPIQKEIQSVQAQENGLKSASAALFIAGITPTMRSLDPQEISFWLSSELCRKLGSSDVVQAKDIAAFHEADLDYKQAYSLISSELLLFKPGSRPHEYFRARSRQDLIRELRAENENELEDIFRCTDFSSFRKSSGNLSKAVSELHSQLDRFELKIANPLPVKESITEAKSKELLSDLTKILSQIRSLGGDQSFLKEALRMRLRGFAEHLRENSKSTSESEAASRRPLFEAIDQFISVPVGTSKSSEKSVKSKAGKTKSRTSQDPSSR